MPGGFRLNRQVGWAYLAVSMLQGLWDRLAALMTGLFLLGLDISIAQAFVGGIGLFILWRRWREAGAHD